MKTCSVSSRSSRTTPQMNYRHVRPVLDAIAGVPDAAAKIHFFVIEKECLVEIANPLQHFPTDDGKSAGNPVDFRRFVLIGPGRSNWPKNRDCGYRADSPLRVRNSFRREGKHRAEGCQLPSRPTNLAPPRPVPVSASMCSTDIRRAPAVRNASELSNTT